MADKILAGIELGGLGFIDVAETVEAGDLVGYSSGWKLAKQAATAIPAVGVTDRAKTYSSATGADNKVQLHTRGIVRGASGLTAGAPVYLAEGGEVSATAGANLAQVVGIAISATDWIIAINAGVGAKPSSHITDVTDPATATGYGWADAAAAAADVAKINAILVALEAHGIVVKA